MSTWFFNYHEARSENPTTRPSLLERIRCLAPSDWTALRLGDAAGERVLSRHGPVEIRQTQRGFAIETRVKGDRDRAYATALRRLAKCASHYNRSGSLLRMARPLVQREEATGRWLVGIGLPGVDDAFVAALWCNGRVRVRAVQPEILAVLRMSGRPTPQAIARGDADLRKALAGTGWLTAGRPMIRRHTSPRSWVFGGWFEVGLPVNAPERND